MSSIRYVPLVLAAAFVSVIPGCGASTTVTTVWKTSDPLPPPFSKVLALVTNASPAERCAGEDQLVLAFKPGQAIASYTLISDEDVKDKERVRALAQRDGFDGAAVIRLVSSDKKTTYVQPNYGPSYSPFSSINSYQPYTMGGGYTTTDTIITAEISLYAVKDERLLWAGSSTTYDPSSIRDLVAQVSRASVEELKKQGLMR